MTAFVRKKRVLHRLESCRTDTFQFC